MIAIATDSAVLLVDPATSTVRKASGLEGSRPTSLAADPSPGGWAWCGTQRGTFRSEDGGRNWIRAGLDEEYVMSLAVSPSDPSLVWAGTEPSVLWRSEDGGRTWAPERGLLDLPSKDDWSFPPKPDTHHVRWITVHPRRPRHLWLAIEAGALITTPDGGRTWKDRVDAGPWDTHELAVHPDRPETLRVAAGDGYFESDDGGSTWRSPEAGLDVTYLRSVAVDPGDPDVTVVSGASGPRSTYVAGRSDGRLYRRVWAPSAASEGMAAWTRIVDGWPDPPSTIAPLLVAGRAAGELWAADERGLHRSRDGGESWEKIAGYPAAPNHLRGIATLATS